MARVHFLNVGNGDCSIIEHNSGRVTMIDICGGNTNETLKKAEATIFEALEPSTQPSGDYGMRRRPTNPIEYMKRYAYPVDSRYLCRNIRGWAGRTFRRL